MGLAPSEPPRELVDALILEAAWERVKQLEGELLTARAMAKQNHESHNRTAERRLKMAYGIRGIISKYEPEAQPGTPLREVIAGLYRLLNDG